ncbi:MAG: hypothetical protein ACKPJJ_22790, partial [Planctomycetaceae bacterium]
MNTSRGISPLGEAYANFGTLGGALTMMGFGAFFGFLFKLTLRLLVRRPTFFFWLPLIFYQAMKAETEFGVVLNQLAKGGMVAVAGYYFMQMNPVFVHFRSAGRRGQTWAANRSGERSYAGRPAAGTRRGCSNMTGFLM